MKIGKDLRVGTYGLGDDVAVEHVLVLELLVDLLKHLKILRALGVEQVGHL